MGLWLTIIAVCFVATAIDVKLGNARAASKLSWPAWLTSVAHRIWAVAAVVSSLAAFVVMLLGLADVDGMPAWSLIVGIATGMGGGMAFVMTTAPDASPSRL